MDVYFLLSCDVKQVINFRIREIEFPKKDLFAEKLSPYHAPTTHSDLHEVFLECALVENGSVIGNAQRTSLKILSTKKFAFDEQVVFPIRICDIGLECNIVLTVYSCNQKLPQTREVDSEFWEGQPNVLACVSLPLFQDQKLRVGEHLISLGTSTARDKERDSLIKQLECINEKKRLVSKMLVPLGIQPILLGSHWLDKLNKHTTLKLEKAKTKQPSSFIKIEFPAFPHDVIFQEKTLADLQSEDPDIDLDLIDDNLLSISELLISDTAPNMTPSEVLSQRLRIAEDKSRRPNREEKKRLRTIILSPSKSSLCKSDMEHIYSFRYYCKDDPKALTKFLQCVDWENEIETDEALSLMEEWAEIDWSDALELLSNRFSNHKVRQFAVEVLTKSDDATFHSIVMQLVKAIRNESAYPSPLSDLLIFHSGRSPSLCSWLYWNIKTESLGSQGAVKVLYTRLLEDFRENLISTQPSLIADIARQEWLVNSLIELSSKLNSKKKACEKEKLLQKLVQEEGEFYELFNFPDPVRLLTKPDTLIYGIDPLQCKVFQSNLCPVKICFRTTDGFESVMWKCGDDLRQDQMIIQLLQLMDKLLIQENLDMELMPVPVLATSPTTGFMEFIENQSAVAKALMKNQNDLRVFLLRNSNNLEASLQRFTKSCAGYSIIMYLLGIGDRHLDNILLREDGRLVHIDFGYVFGDDPHPMFRLPIKLTKEMVSAMDGPYYEEFLRNLFLVYKCLRRNASLILNLIMLMTSHEENSFLKNATAYVEERFSLDLTDEECETHILNLVKTSGVGMGAIFARWYDKAHDFKTKRL